MGDTRTKEDLYNAFAEVGKVLSNGKRIEILDVLSQGERSVELLSDRIGTSMTTTSAHLQIMRRSGLVTTRREGTRIFYMLSSFAVVELLECFRGVALNHYERAEIALERYLGDAEGELVEQANLEDRIASGNVVVLDVRPQEEYLAGHIPGAISIPLEELSAEVERILDLSQIGSISPVGSGGLEVVVYCRGAYCSFANDALSILKQHNLRAVRLSDGFTEWKVAGREVEV